MNTDTLLGAAIGATLTLTILWCGFWAVVFWWLARSGKNDARVENNDPLNTFHIPRILRNGDE